METESKDSRFLISMFAGFVVGLFVAVGVYLVWLHQPEGRNSQALTTASLLLCPPFLLALETGVRAESDLVLVLSGGTIVFANGFLYAGLIAGAFAIARGFAAHKH